MHNYWTDNEKYFKYCEDTGNRFMGVRKMAAEARKLAEDHDNLISHSEALSWATTGDRPAILDAPLQSARGPVNIVANMTDIVLSEVSDPEIIESVKQSVRESFAANHLVYMYTPKVFDEFRRGRVRILVRKIWYNSK